jgi:hypothetical protein
MALRDQPYFPLYVQDFLTDEKLNCCSAATQGVYIKILCILHKQEEYGCILFKQKDKQTDDKLKNFALKFAKLLPFDSNTIHEALIELIDEGVLIIDGDKLYQKRMVKDGEISLTRSKAGKIGGGNPNLFKQNDKQMFKQKYKQNTENENEDIIISLSKSSSNESSRLEQQGKPILFDFDCVKKRQYLESVYRATVLIPEIKVDINRFEKLTDQFIAEQQLKDEPPRNVQDYKNHFISWMKIQVVKPENQPKTKMVY